MSGVRIFLADESAGGWLIDFRDAAGAARPRFDGDADAAGAVPSATAPPAQLTQLTRGTAVSAIVPAARMRTLSVSVPPAADHKLPAVIRFALEDQLAGDVDLQHVVVAARRAHDVLVHVIDRRWLLAALSRLADRGVRAERIVAESDLAPRAAGVLGTWIWRGDGGFLIEAGGKVTVLDQSSDALPSGLLLAINRDPAREARERRIVVHGPADLGARVHAWSRATRVDFEMAAPWTWRDAPGADVAGAPNLVTPALHASAGSATQPARARWLRRALWWTVAAVLLHAGASAAEWATLQWRVGAAQRDIERMIHAAAPELSGDLEAAWRARYAALRHQLGKAAADDALPLLADASAGLRELPPGAVRVINFEAGQLTLDVERAAAPAIAAALPRWSASGLSVLQADSPAGLRVRLTRQ